MYSMIKLNLECYKKRENRKNIEYITDLYRVPDKSIKNENIKNTVIDNLNS